VAKVITASGHGTRRDMDKKSTDAWEGWSIVGAVTIALILGVTVEAMTAATPLDGIRGIIRMTARSSFALFALAFTAAATWRFWPNKWTRWQLRSRRYLGVAFAVSHTVHLFAIFALGRVAPAVLAAESGTITWIFGGIAYVFIWLMALTSFDITARSISPRTWSWLHTVGSYYVWFVFANSYLSRAAIIPAYIPVGVLVIFILGLRIAARISKLRSHHDNSNPQNVYR
jgi:methionine sulfoxide reductase heme-binding subunit